MPSSRFSTFQAVALPLLMLSTSVAAQTFIGCSTADTQGEGDPAMTIQGNQGKCVSTCQTDGLSYAYYNALEQECTCSSVSPYAYNFDGATSGSTCNDEDYTVLDLTTTFQFQGCYSNMVTDAAPANTDTLEECFAACASEGSVMFEPVYDYDLDQYNFGCRCNTASTIDGTGGEAVTCGSVSDPTWYTYTHSAVAQASGLARRAMRARLERAKRQAQILCPAGLTACNVPGYTAYECIDTRSELESCGGCLYGEYLNNATAAVGTDCTSLSGVSRGAVTCFNGQCEAFACSKGYDLVAGKCASSL